MSAFDEFALWLGYLFMAIAGVGLVAFSLICLALLSNRAQNHLIETYGGWKVFMQFRDWYHANQKEAP